MHTSGPVIGITADLADDRYRVSRAYADLIERAGGVPIVLPPRPGSGPAILNLCDGFVLTGGDDPSMECFGEPTHPRATPVHPDRQSFELELLALLAPRDAPLLGVCLGMQLMGLAAGGRLDQHLPDSLDSAALHWDHGAHDVAGTLGTGTVHSHHRQALTDAGSLDVIATAADGVIEAIRDSGRPFRVGVQWHPERTDTPALGSDLFRDLVSAARTTSRTSGRDHTAEAPVAP